MSDQPDAQPKSFNERLRARWFGTPSRPESVIPKSNQMGFFGRVQRPGGFDTPPQEPVELEGPIPWELRDPDESREA
jgi:hypothetical protein